MEAFFSHVHTFSIPEGYDFIRGIHRHGKRIYIVFTTPEEVHVVLLVEYTLTVEWNIPLSFIYDDSTITGMENNKPILVVRGNTKLRSYRLLESGQYVPMYDGHVEYPCMGIVRLQHSNWATITRTPNYAIQIEEDRRSLLPAYPGVNRVIQYKNGYILLVVRTGVLKIIGFDPITGRSYVYDDPNDIDPTRTSLFSEDTILLSDWESGYNCISNKDRMVVYQVEPQTTEWATAGDGKTVCKILIDRIDIYEYTANSIRSLLEQ